jgi:hypothetical protein
MSTATVDVKPLAGPRFRRASALPMEGRKRRRLLLLLAAFADAGEHSPRAVDLCTRAGIRSPVALDHLLDQLVEAGLLEVEWARSGPPGRRAALHDGRRNVYTLRLDREDCNR